MMDDLATWFAYPMLLGLWAALPVLAGLLAFARWRRRRAYSLLGDAGALHKLLVQTASPRWLRVGCLFLGLALVIVAAAGPRWGKTTAQTAPARPLVVVLDASRSMLAGQPSRQELARRALRDLAQTLSERGGPRLALVIFAAHARLAMPLTGDYDHLLDLLRDIDADDLPPALRPRGGDGLGSGTRIGEALRLALHAMDAEHGGDIILLSDGDDPGSDDEWLQGAEEARRHHVPVHTIGLGDPRQDATIPFGGGVLLYDGKPVLSRLHEGPLQEIARRTGGAYVPAHTDNLPLGKLLPSILTQRSPDDELAADAAIPIWKPRYRWFLTPALLLLAVPLVVGKRRLPDIRRAAVPFGKMLMLALCLSLVSAAPPPSVNKLLREGDNAFEALQNSEALALFERAEDLAPDPALVAFNEGAALYRLERYADAAMHYQRCLEDSAGPARRRAWAYFQIGNAYVRAGQGVDRGLLEKSLAAYRACLAMKESSSDLRGDARHNLELTRMLWLKSLPNPDELPKGDEPPPNSKQNNLPRFGPNDKKDDGRFAPPSPAPDEQDGHQVDNPGNNSAAGKAKNASSGPLTVLPDKSELVPMSPEDTQAHLEEIARRIKGERRHFRRHAVVAPDNVKDW